MPQNPILVILAPIGNHTFADSSNSDNNNNNNIDNKQMWVEGSLGYRAQVQSGWVFGPMISLCKVQCSEFASQGLGQSVQPSLDRFTRRTAAVQL